MSSKQPARKPVTRSAARPQPAITESSNPLTVEIDRASPYDILRLLRQADAQIQTGYGIHPGLVDPAVAERVAQVVHLVRKALKDPKGLIVFSGAGTSGRVAMLAARTYNHILRREEDRPFRYLMAGGIPALIQAQEGAEDDAKQAIADLEKEIGAARNVVYVGITCGLSAPYILGQLEWMIQKKRGTAVLLGFNPLEMARDIPIEGWPRTFRQGLARISSSPRFIPLVPVVGPEPIMGSTRMKSGTATKLVLDVIFENATEGGDVTANEIIGNFQYDYEFTDMHWPLRHQVEPLVALGAAALRHGARITYVGGVGPEPETGRMRHDAAILGLIDASECPPTYGADFEDVRGYLVNGWKDLFPGGEADLSGRAPHYRLSLEDFRRDRLPRLGKHDLVVFIGRFPGDAAVVRACRHKGATLGAISWSDDQFPGVLKQHTVTLRGMEKPSFIELSQFQIEVKLILNAITTGAHVLAGKVYENRMIDLRISNNKLFFRTIRIIQDITGASEERARAALLGSVYGREKPTAAQAAAPVSAHIEAAKAVRKVVPRALLLATGRFTIASADAALRKEPIVRNIIARLAAGA